MVRAAALQAEARLRAGWPFGIAQQLVFRATPAVEIEDRARRKLGVVLEPAAYDEADVAVSRTLGRWSCSDVESWVQVAPLLDTS